MSTYWNNISHLGLSESKGLPEQRHFILANQLNFVLLVITLIITIATTVFREINHGEFTVHTQKIVVLTAICGINLWLANRKMLNVVRFNLIFFPSLITVFLPIFLGYAQNDDFYMGPLLIMAFSLFPAMILTPNFNNRWYTASILFFFAQVAAIDHAITFFATQRLELLQIIEHIHFYYKLVTIMVFVFITLVIHYYRALNLRYERELNNNNQALHLKIEELNTTQEKLIQAEKMASLGVLTAGVAHEINNPLNYIMGGYIGLSEHFNHPEKDNSEHVGFFLESIKTGVDRASEVVKALGQFSRGNHVYTEMCNLHDIIDNCLVMLNAHAKNNIAITTDFATGPFIIQGNAGKLHQVLINVLINAIHAIEKHGQIAITTRKNGPNVTIEVTDNGTGIRKEHLSKVTDPFFTTKEPGKGTGLGLSISYSIIKEHLGNIEFESEEGFGTTVKMTFPCTNQ